MIDRDDGQEDYFPEPVVLAPSDELDLHGFNPREIKPLINDYLDQSREAGFVLVRIIHGRGKGVLRRTVHALLERHDKVIDFRLDNPGATVVRLEGSN